MRRPGWKIDIYSDVRLDGVVDNFCVWAFAWRRPDGETEFAAGFEDAERLGARALGIGQMEQCEVRYDASEAGIGKWQILRVAFAKFDVGKHFFRDRDHLLGKVEANRLGAAFRRRGRDVTRAAADIQDRHARRNLSGIEQRRNELSRRG